MPPKCNTTAQFKTLPLQVCSEGLTFQKPVAKVLDHFMLTVVPKFLVSRAPRLVGFAAGSASAVVPSGEVERVIRVILPVLHATI